MLYELIKPYKSVSLIGMCKNAGKTTVLNRLIRDCRDADEPVALTSIGRDGERSDLVTNTKKPEIFVYDGTIIATAEKLLSTGVLSDLGNEAQMNGVGCGISREILDTTGMPTPMGEVIILRACSDGFVQLAGPSMTAQLTVLKKRMLELGASKVIIDGALSRKSLAMPAVSDAAILCSGASYSPDIRKTVQDTGFAAELMLLPQTERSAAARQCEQKYCVFFDDAEPVKFAELSSAAELVRKGGAAAVLLRGGVPDSAANALIAAGHALNGLEIICEDGSRLLLSHKNYEKLVRAGARFTVLNKTRLLAVTVNPFSAKGSHYNKTEFYKAVCGAVGNSVPVLDVVSEFGCGTD